MRSHAMVALIALVVASASAWLGAPAAHAWTVIGTGHTGTNFTGSPRELRDHENCVTQTAQSAINFSTDRIIVFYDTWNCTGATVVVQARSQISSFAAKQSYRSFDAPFGTPLGAVSNPVPCGQEATNPGPCAASTVAGEYPSGCASLAMGPLPPLSGEESDSESDENDVVDDVKQAECSAQGQADQQLADPANNDFGTRSFDESLEFYGSEASIRVPADGHFLEADEFVLHRVVLQSSFATDKPGLAQAGIYRSGSNVNIGNCDQASNGNYYRFREYKLHYYADTVSNYHCRIFTELGALTPGSDTDTTFGVHYIGANTGTDASNRPHNWAFDISSGTREIVPLNFKTGVPAIGAEIADNGANDEGGANDFASRTSTVYGTTRSWRVDEVANDSSPRRVEARDPNGRYSSHDPARWTVPLPPTPFTIAHN